MPLFSNPQNPGLLGAGGAATSSAMWSPPTVERELRLAG